MKRNMLVTVALAAIAVMLLLYIQYGDEPKSAQDEVKEWTPEKVIPEGAELLKIRLTTDMGEMLIVRDPKRDFWTMEEPAKDVLEPYFLQMFKNDLVNLKKEKLIEIDAEDLAKYGLEEPDTLVRVSYADGEPDTVLEVGKINYMRDHYFAKFAGDNTVFQIPVALRIFFETPINTFRARTLFLSLPTQVLTLEIDILDEEVVRENPQSVQPKIIVQDQASGPPTWSMLEPFHEKADLDTVAGFFHRLKNNSATELVDLPENNLADFKLDEPDLKITLTLKNGRKEEIFIGPEVDEEGSRWARNTNRPVAVKVDKSFYDFVLSAHFRDADIIDTNRRIEVTRLELRFPRDPEKKLTLVPDKPGTFHFEEDPSFKTIYPRGAKGVQVFNTQGIHFLYHLEPFPRDEMGLDLPKLRLTAFENEHMILDVSVGDTASRGGSIYTFIEDHKRNAILAIDKDVMFEVPTEMEHYKVKEEMIERFQRRFAIQKE